MSQWTFIMYYMDFKIEFYELLKYILWTQKLFFIIIIFYIINNNNNKLLFNFIKFYILMAYFIIFMNKIIK